MMNKLIRFLFCIVIIYCQCVILADGNKILQGKNVGVIDPSDVLLPSHTDPDIAKHSQVNSQVIKIAPAPKDKASFVEKQDQGLLRWKNSLFFDDDKLQLIENMISNNQHGSKAGVENSLGVPARILPNLYLSSIIYVNESQWVAIINGVLINKKQAVDVPRNYKTSQPTSDKVKLIITNVNANFVNLSVDIGNNLDIDSIKSLLEVKDNSVFTNFDNSIIIDTKINTLTLKLHPNQSFNGTMLAIQEGYHTSNF